MKTRMLRSLWSISGFFFFLTHVSAEQLPITTGFYFMPNDTKLTKVDKDESNRLATICGRPSPQRKYPWSVSLTLNGFNKLGGAIISDRHVLTVAHGFLRFDSSKPGACVVLGYKEFTTISMKRVLFGSDCIHFAKTRKSLPPTCNQTKLQIRFIRAAAVDHGFAAGMCVIGHDWAIIELTKPIEFNENVAPICLPFAKQQIHSLLTVPSWGRPSRELGIRQQVDMRVTSAFQDSAPLIRDIDMRHDPTCTPPWSDLMPTQSGDYLCAKSLDPSNPQSKRTCHGDSGSGIQQIDSNGITTLVGLTSFGSQGCPSNELARFTRVQNYVDDICRFTGVCYTVKDRK